MALPLVFALLLFSHHVVGQCPSLTSIYPPSGLRNQQTFVITGENLDSVNSVDSSSGVVNTIMDNSTTISFTIDGSGTITISLLPTDSTNCNTTNDVIDVKGPKVNYDIAGANLEGQPGTVLFIGGCFPSICGDNSTSYSIKVGGVDAELLNETEFGESRNLESEFFIRLGPITSPIPAAQLTLISQYGTEYVSSNTATINYQLGSNITAVSPSVGQKGTEVYITGTNLIGLSNLDISLDQASLGGVPAEILSANQSTVILKAKSGAAGVGAIELNSTLLTPGNNIINGPYLSVSGQWEYLEEGIITQLIPPAGQEGTTMSICGSSILGGGTSVLDVTIIGVSLSTFSSGLENLADPNVPDECIRGTVPAPSGPLPQEGGINITADTKALVTTADGVTFKYANISYLSPNEGQEYTIVTIVGVHLLSGYNMTEVNAPTVVLGSNDATVLSYSESEIIVQAKPPDMPSLAIDNPSAVEIIVSKFGLNFSVKLNSAWTYLEPGNITNAEPSFGQIGTRVTISGTNLLGYGNQLEYVSILGTDTGFVDSDLHVNATLINQNDTLVTIDMPLTINSMYSGYVDVLLVADNGAQIRGNGVFQYLMKGSITSVSPNEGQAGTYISINGTNLFGYGLNITQVRIGTAIAEILYEDTSNSSINVRATSLEVTETTPVDVTLISDTNAIVMSADQPFSYLEEGQVNNISPDIGQIGTMVNITGTNLLGGGTNINTILLDGVIPLAISIYSDTSVVITLGDHATRDPNFYPGQVYIESNTGATVIGGIFSHKPPGNITSVEPTVGRRGTMITLNGYNLTGFGNYIESVFIGNYNVSDAMSLETTEGDTSLIVAAPNAPEGHSGPIKLIIDTGASIASTQSFTFVQSGSITNVTPNVGAEGRGVLIEGLNLIVNSLDITCLTIGGSEVTRIVTESSSQISIIAGKSPNGTLDNLPITVTLSDGSFIQGGAFTYEEYAVMILGTNEGQFGTKVIIKVSFAMDSILSVKFDDIETDILQVDSQNSTVTVEAPRAKIPGNYTVDVTVENIDNIIARLSAGFTYLTEGFICTVSPSEGQRGTRVRIVGENLLGGGNNITEIKFGLISATVHSYSNNEINASLSDNNDDYPVTVDITIVSDTGAIITFTDGFTIITPGNIESVTPNSGQYGTLVTITGMGLLEGDKDLVSVTLTGTEAVVIGTPNDTTIVVSAGVSNFSIIGLVSILTSTGAEIISDQSNQFQYLMPGMVNSVSPTNGTQGTIVTITGQDMLNGGSSASIVTLGEITAEIIESNDTLITVLAGAGGNGTASAGDIVITSNTGSIVTQSSVWTYIEPGNISSFSPSSGQQGVIVMIEGDGLLADQEDDIMYIELAGVMATVIEKTSAKIVVEAGYSSTSQSGLIVVKLVSGPVITSLTNWTYYAASLDFVSLSNGINGTYVTLTGINIIGEPNTAYDVSSVTFGGIPCYDLQTISQDSVRVRAGFSDTITQQNDVRITSTSGAYLVLKEAWNYLPNGEIVTLEPTAATPGDNVTIIGTNLVPSTASSVIVTVGKTVSFSAYIVNSSAITFRVGLYSAPDQPGTNLSVHIVANDGATVISDNDMFSFISTFIAESVTPYAGQAGTEVVINGSNLFDEDNEPFEVYLAGIQADILYYTNNTMTVRTGDGPVEGISGSVTVVNGNGTFIGLGGTAWTYLPVLSTNHVSPLSGRNGSLVTIDMTSVQAMFVLQSVFLGDQEAAILLNNGGIIKLSVGEFENSSSIENITLYYEDGVSLVIIDSWNYQPLITINETSSIPQGYYNSIVTIYGDGFNGGNANVLVSAVTLAGFNTNIVSQTDVSLVVQITDNYDSNGAAIIGSIIITSVDGARYDSKFVENITFTYVQVKIDTVSPVQGQNGTRVTLTGIGLLAGANSIASVMLAGIEAETINVASDTLITVSAGGYNNATGSEDIEYTVNTGAMVTIANSWSYISLGEIITVTPTNGSKGTVVNILGDGLLGGGVKAEVVFLNGVEALEVLVSNDKIVQVRAGDSDPKMAGEVTIISNTGAILSSTINDDLSFEYIAAPGTINTIMPMVGQFGTKVTINGIDLHKGDGISSVTIAGVEATISKYNSTEVEVIVQRPPITSSFSGLVVIESDYRSLIESVNNFTYLREGDITSIVPSQGQRGTRVTIKGNRLYGGGSTITSVVMAGIMADIISLSDSEIQVEIKENTDSLTEDVNGDILLMSNSGAQVSLIDSWTYIQVGVISSVMPESGQYGTRVTITGDRLTAGGSSVQKVIIGDTDSYAVVSSNDNEVVFRVGEPDGLSPFAGLIKLVSDDYGEIESQVYWNYTASSEIIDVSPANGTGGTVIVITGTNLLGGIGLNVTKIEIVGISVNLILSQNDTAIEVEVGFNPDGQEKEGDIVIETDSGSINYLQNGWVYLSECPIGQFGNNTNSCSLCNVECDHCYGPTEYECYSCKNFEIVTDLQSQCVAKCPGLSKTDKVCVDACGTDQFLQTRLDNNTYCIDCHQQCDPNLSCSGEEASQCTDCLNVALNGVCIEICPVGHFVGNESECIPCNDECQLEAGCRGPEPHECNKCLNVTIFKLDQQIDECIPVCPSGYYTNSTGYCQLCHPQCNGGCDGPLSFDCYECKNAILIDSLGNEQCVEECTDNLDYNIYYLNSTGYCDGCHSYCSTTAGCIGPLESDCIACLNFTGSNSDTNEFFPKLNNQCVRECPTIEYYVDLRSGECLDCNESCTIGCSGPTANDCIIDDVTTNSTMTKETSSLFKAGVGTIGLVVGLFVVLFIIMLIVIVVLACKLKGRDDSKSYSFAANGEHTIIPMHTTTTFNRTDSSVVPTTRPIDYVTPRNSNINPIFGDSSYMEARQTEPTGGNQLPTTIEEDTDQMTSEDFYMDMEFEYKQSLTSTNGSTKQDTSVVPPPILPKLNQSSNGGPPIPAKRLSTKLSTGSYKPAPPLPTQITMIDDHTIDELLTQDEDEGFLLANLPPPPQLHPSVNIAATSTSTNTMGNIYDFSNENEEAVYEEADLVPTVRYSAIQHDLPQLPASISMPQVPPPTIPARQTSRASIKSSGRSNNVH